MSAYYNEFNPEAAAWLRELIKSGVIADGVVDERSIREVQPEDLRGFVQCHFFAGIGVWSYALRLAGWPDDRPVWTGSCPCQPFSTAGTRQGFGDERHLWPDFFKLIREQRPPTVFGEQVASKDGRAWLDLVHADMEGAGYALGALDLCAAGFGAPHIRQRMWFVGERLADPTSLRREQQRNAKVFEVQGVGSERSFQQQESGGSRQLQGGSEGLRRAGELAHADSYGWHAEVQPGVCGSKSGWGRIEMSGPGPSRVVIHVGHPLGEGLEGHAGDVYVSDQFRRIVEVEAGSVAETSFSSKPGPLNGFWRVADWLYCRDGKWRPVESGSFPLVDGAPPNMGLLWGYGNAINAEVAKEFITAYMLHNMTV